MQDGGHCGILDLPQPWSPDDPPPPLSTCTRALASLGTGLTNLTSMVRAIESGKEEYMNRVSATYLDGMKTRISVCGEIAGAGAGAGTLHIIP